MAAVEGSDMDQDENYRSDKADLGWLWQGLALLLSALGLMVAVNLATARSELWYCTPLVNEHILKLYALAMEPGKYDVITLGSSVGERAIVPQVIEEELNKALPGERSWAVYNGSVPGSMVPVYRDVMRTLTDARERPSMAMLVVGPRDFNGNGTRMGRHLRHCVRTPPDLAEVLAANVPAGQKLSALRSLTKGIESLLQYPALVWEPDRMLFFRNNRGGIIAYPLTEEARRINRLLIPSPGGDFEELRAEKLRIAREEQLVDFEINGLVRHMFEDTLELARGRGIYVVVLFSPATSWFEKRAFARGEKEKTIEFVSGACKKHGAGFVDLGSEAYKPDDSRFFDGADHLDIDGSIELSRAVARRVVIPAARAGRLEKRKRD